MYRRKLLQQQARKHIERQIAEKPKLVQITTGWGARGNDAVLGRNRYVALNLSAKNGKSKAPLSPYQKPCKQMSEAIVVDGTERGHIVKVCADPTCPVHFADRHTPNPEQMAKEREQRRKELERQKLEATVRHRTLAEVLKRIGSPLDRADLALVASGLLNKLEPMRKEVLARRHKLIEKTERYLRGTCPGSAPSTVAAQSPDDYCRAASWRSIRGRHRRDGNFAPVPRRTRKLGTGHIVAAAWLSGNQRA